MFRAYVLALLVQSVFVVPAFSGSDFTDCINKMEKDYVACRDAYLSSNPDKAFLEKEATTSTDWKTRFTAASFLSWLNHEKLFKTLEAKTGLRDQRGRQILHWNVKGEVPPETAPFFYEMIYRGLTFSNGFSSEESIESALRAIRRQAYDYKLVPDFTLVLDILENSGKEISPKAYAGFVRILKDASRQETNGISFRRVIQVIEKSRAEQGLYLISALYNLELTMAERDEAVGAILAAKNLVAEYAKSKIEDSVFGIGGETVAALLIDRLATEADPVEQSHYLNLLATSGSATAYPCVRCFATDLKADPYTRVNAIRVIGYIAYTFDIYRDLKAIAEDTQYSDDERYAALVSIRDIVRRGPVPKNELDTIRKELGALDTSSWSPNLLEAIKFVREQV